jgi:hypothetical protein
MSRANSGENSPEFSAQKGWGIFPENSLEDSLDFSREDQLAGEGGLASFGAAAAMIVASPILMGAPKPRPVTDQRS